MFLHVSKQCSLSVFHLYCVEYRRLIWEKTFFPLQLKPISITQFQLHVIGWCQAACLDQLWRAFLNASRRLRSHLKRCDTSSLSAPALLLLPVAPGLCRLSRQLNHRQHPRSPYLLRVGEIEGAHARHNATPS